MYATTVMDDSPDTCSDGLRARTGSAYLAGLADGREVWLDGQRVSSVVDHPQLAGAARTVSSIFDLQHDHPADMIATDPTSGARVATSHIIPRSGEDLARRHRALEHVTRATFGLVGRSPDYVNISLAGFAGRSSTFAVQGNEHGAANLARFHHEAMLGDYAMTHALVNLNVDRRRHETRGGDGEIVVHKVAETAESIVVRGSRGLATLAPFSDEIFVYPGYPMPADADDYSISFSVPVDTPGVKLFCRDSYSRPGSTFDAPFSSRFDEQDAVVIFDDVEVPRHRVFIDANAAIYNNVIKSSGWTANIMQQTTIRAHTKLQLAWELGTAMTEAVGHVGPDAQALLGEIWSYLELTRAALAAAEAHAYDHGDGVWFCDERPFLALRPTLPLWFPRVNEILRLLGGQNLLTTPVLAELHHDDLAGLLALHHQGADGGSARGRVALFRAAWDLIGTSLAGRSDLYERFYLGSSNRWMQLNHQAARRTTSLELVAALTDTMNEAAAHGS